MLSFVSIFSFSLIVFGIAIILGSFILKGFCFVFTTWYWIVLVAFESWFPLLILVLIFENIILLSLIFLAESASNILPSLIISFIVFNLGWFDSVASDDWTPNVAEGIWELLLLLLLLFMKIFWVVIDSVVVLLFSLGIKDLLLFKKISWIFLLSEMLFIFSDLNKSPNKLLSLFIVDCWILFCVSLFSLFKLNSFILNIDDDW